MVLIEINIEAKLGLEDTILLRGSRDEQGRRYGIWTNQSPGIYLHAFISPLI